MNSVHFSAVKMLHQQPDGQLQIQYKARTQTIKHQNNNTQIIKKQRNVINNGS
jgi:hypothetical protein